MDKPLAGVRILDLTRLLPGAYCTLRLAALGADVIKVEEPVRGDYMRDLGLGELFALVNRGKRSIALDLKADAGRSALARLAASADVLVESFRPGTFARLAGDPRQANPRLIVCSLSGYGPDGPYRDWPGHDVNYLAIAGYLGLQRPPDGDPVLPPTPLADVLGGMEAAMAIMAALAAPVRGGAIALSLFEAARSVMLLPLAHGATVQPGGTALTGATPGYGVYRCRDGRHVGVGALEPRFWAALCRGLGRPDLEAMRAQDPAGAQAVLRAAFAAAPQAHWVAALPPEACVTPVLTMAESLADPQSRTRGLFAVCPELGPAPALGQHTAEILRQVGM